MLKITVQLPVFGIAEFDDQQSIVVIVKVKLSVRIWVDLSSSFCTPWSCDVSHTPPGPVLLCDGII